jgi:predicted transport protein
MPRDPEDRRAAIARKLEERSGRLLADWIALVKGSGAEKRKERVEWLKREHGLGHSQASIVVEYASRGADYEAPSADELIESQYAGDRAPLRPLFEELRQRIESLGTDVSVEPRKAYVAFARDRQFALVEPSTKTRLDVGLSFPETAATDRLRPAGAFGTERTTHRVEVSSKDDLDDELVGWLRAAYEQAGA